MAAFYRFIIGTASTTSTPDSPKIHATDFYEFAINPVSWDGSYNGGTLVTTISGSPRVSTTQVPKDTINISWPKLTSTAKRTYCDYYFLMNKKLILIDDQRYMYEVVVAPSSYKYARRRSTNSEVESYTVKVMLILTGGGIRISESARESMETLAGAGTYIGEDLIA